MAEKMIRWGRKGKGLRRSRKQGKENLGAT
jgi:hypothetical protein